MQALINLLFSALATNGIFHVMPVWIGKKRKTLPTSDSQPETSQSKAAQLSFGLVKRKHTHNSMLAPHQLNSVCGHQAVNLYKARKLNKPPAAEGLVIPKRTKN